MNSINQVKRSKNGLNVTYVDDEGNDMTMKGVAPIHSDLANAFASLLPYFAILTEQKEAAALDMTNPQSYANIKMLDKLTITGIRLTSTEDGFKCCISGKRRTDDNKEYAFSAPAVDVGVMSSYVYAPELRTLVEDVLDEADLYVTQRKTATPEEQKKAPETKAPFGDD